MTYDETMQKLLQIAQRKGLHVIEAKPVSKHPDDGHLVYVVVFQEPVEPDMWTKTGFIGYTFNAADGCEGFAHGHYGLTLNQAAEWLSTRGEEL